MTTQSSPPQARFHLPELAQRPALGSMCCVMPMEDLIRDELRLWPGVDEVDVDLRTCRIDVRLTTGHPPEADLVWSLDKLGFTDIHTKQFPTTNTPRTETQHDAGPADA